MVPTSQTHYQSIPETTADLPWADLVAIDLSKFDHRNGKQELAAQLEHATSTVGFFSVTKFGLSEAEVDAQFEIAQEIFALPEDEKQPYRVDPSKQGLFGWKLKGSRSSSMA